MPGACFPAVGESHAPQAHNVAPSDEGAVSEADWGREMREGLMLRQIVENSLPPSALRAATSLVRGRFRREWLKFEQ